MSEPDFSTMTKAELNHYIKNFVNYSPLYKAALAELSKREKLEEDKTASHIDKSIFWSRIAGIAAIVAVILALIQIAVSVYPLITSHETEKIRMLRQAPNTQLTTNNTASSSSSHTSTYMAPSKKAK